MENDIDVFTEEDDKELDELIDELIDEINRTEIGIGYVSLQHKIDNIFITSEGVILELEKIQNYKEEKCSFNFFMEKEDTDLEDFGKYAGRISYLYYNELKYIKSVCLRRVFRKDP